MLLLKQYNKQFFIFTLYLRWMLVTISIYLVYTLGIWEIRKMKVVAKKENEGTSFRLVLFFKFISCMEMEKCDENWIHIVLFRCVSAHLYVLYVCVYNTLFLLLEYKTFSSKL